MAEEFAKGRLAAFRDPDGARERLGLWVEAHIIPTDGGDLLMPDADHEALAHRLIDAAGAKDTPDTVARLAEALCRAEMRAMAALCDN
jgi:hypothetical protein